MAAVAVEWSFEAVPEGLARDGGASRTRRGGLAGSGPVRDCRCGDRSRFVYRLGRSRVHQSSK